MLINGVMDECGNVKSSLSKSWLGKILLNYTKI